MPQRNGPELPLAFRQRDVKAPLASPDALQKELQAQGRLAAPGSALHEMGTAGRVSTPENCIKARHPCGDGSGVEEVGRHRQPVRTSRRLQSYLIRIAMANHRPCGDL